MNLSRWFKWKGRKTEIRYDDDKFFVIDEIVAPGIHLEMMSDTTCWMKVNGVVVWFTIQKRKLIVTAEPEDAKRIEDRT